MKLLSFTIASALVLLGTSAQAQLVTQGAPSRAAEAKSSHKAHAKPKALADFGISTRTLWIEKRSGEKDDLVFRFATFARKTETDHGMPVYDVFGKDPFSEAGSKVPLGQIRISEQGPEFSKRFGGPWAQGEKDHDTWVFALDQLTIRVDRMDEVFTPTSIKVLAFERGVDVKTTPQVIETDRYAPLYHSVVAAFAFGNREVRGTLKYPGSTFVVSFQGVQWKDHWVARSNGTGPFNITVVKPTGTSTDAGGRPLSTGNSLITQIDLDGQRILLGSGPSLNYALEGNPADRLTTAVEFEMAKAKELPSLAEAYRANLNRDPWTKTDEDASFSREAEKAYGSLGLKTWFWVPMKSRWQGGPSGMAAAAAKAFMDPMINRVKAFGGAVGFLDFNGEPMQDPTASLSGPDVSPTAASSPSPRIPAFPLAAFEAQDHLVTIHMSGEVRSWAPDRTKFDSRNVLSLGEMLTAGASASDGKGFVTTGNAGVRQWDGTSCQCLRILPMDGCKGWWCAGYSPDGRLIAAGGNDGRTRLWDAQTGMLIGATSKGSGWGFSLTAPSGSLQKPEFIASVAFSPDGKRLAEGTASGELRIWDMTDPTAPKKLKFVDLGRNFGKVFRVRFLHGGTELLALDQAGSFQVLDCQSWRVARKAEMVLPTTTSVVFSPGEDWFITAHEGGRVVRTNLASGAIESDRRVDGVVIGALALYDGKIQILGEKGWKTVEL